MLILNIYKLCIVVLGLLTVIPTAGAIAFMVGLLASMFGLWAPTRDSLVSQVLVVIILGIWSIALGIFYARHFLNNDSIPAGERTITNSMSLIGNLYAMPMYWYWHVYTPGMARESTSVRISRVGAAKKGHHGKTQK